MPHEAFDMKNTCHAFSTPTVSLFLALGRQLLQAFTLAKHHFAQLAVVFFQMVQLGNHLAPRRFMHRFVRSHHFILASPDARTFRKQFETSSGSCNRFCQATLIHQNPKKAIMLEEMPIAQILQMMQRSGHLALSLSLPVHHHISCLLS